MGAFKDEEILGFLIGGKYVCRECANAEEDAEVSQDGLIVDSNEGLRIFCDRCKGRVV